MNIWHDISPELITPQQFTAVIEIPMGSKKKYEMDKRTGLLRLDRILHTIRQTMVSFPAPMPMTATRSMFWFCAPNRSTRS